MNRERLAKLALFLQTVPAENFDLQNWRSPCGTTACAVGWACTIPEFKKEGFYLLDRYSTQSVIPVYKDKDHFEAVEAFFDISWRDVEWLFMPDQDNYNTTTHVIDRIGELLKLDYYSYEGDMFYNQLREIAGDSGD